MGIESDEYEQLKLTQNSINMYAIHILGTKPY